MTKILLVEDDKSLREIYGVRLLAEGYDIASAGDGEEALAMAIKERPQLIVSDVMMPKISGFDMLDILRSTTETKDIKVIMMTALSSEDQRQRGEQLGADRYLVKSQVGIEDVVRTVHDVLGDIPTAAPSPQQTFATPGPSAVARPATPAVPPRPAVAPQPSPQQPQEPQQQQPAPQPTPQAPVVQPPAPTPAPQPPQATPQPPQPAPAPEPSENQGLPQPTAPFSTPRPASLGERIIQPLQQESNQHEDVAARLEMELGNIAPPPAPPAPQPMPAAPTPPPTAPPMPPTPAGQPNNPGGMPQ